MLRLQKLLNTFGYSIEKESIRRNHLKRRLMLMQHYNIDKVFDVGANIGQYALSLLNNDFNGDILSFEPLNEVYKRLVAKSEKYDNWKTYNYALGSETTRKEINVSAHSDSSSLLPMLPVHLEMRPSSKYIGKQLIEVFKLDDIFDEITNPKDHTFLKIDAQGYEFRILEGAKESLNIIKGIQLELSIVPMYEGEHTICDMIRYLNDLGFELMSIEPGATDGKTGRMFQVDGIFFKE